VFAYGQTSSGKTYTMQGSANYPGIIRDVFDSIFYWRSNLGINSNREFLVRVSYMDIYNEEMNGLLTREFQGNICKYFSHSYTSLYRRGCLLLDSERKLLTVLTILKAWRRY
ncbi:hypothetical protein SELMODRAFT_94977, partial [Selaginella moellendorffii]